jgi:hypothetical protein
MMRFLMALFTTLVVVACSTTPAAREQPHPRNATLHPDVELLLTSAATDFHTHPAVYPARLRNVRSGYVVAADGTRQYRVCGEFLPAQAGGSAEWTRFATVRTSRYEQWIGGQAAPYCEASMTWDEGDLSSELQSRLDSLATAAPGTT